MNEPQTTPNPQKPDLKSILTQNNRVTKIISVVSLILVIFGIFAFIIIGLYRFELFEFPEFIQNIFSKKDDGNFNTGKNDRNIREFVINNKSSDKPSDNRGYVFEITLENLREIISNIKLPDSLYIYTEANYYKSGELSRTEGMELWKKGEKYKYSLSVNSIPEETYINDSVNELIENHQTGHSVVKPVSALFSFDNIPHISNIEFYLNLLETGQIVNCSPIYYDNNSNIICITYFVPNLNQTEDIEISLDTGIVSSLWCYIGEYDDLDLYYESKTTVYNDGSDISAGRIPIPDSLFIIDME